jgi:hypothetical protein
VNRSRETDTPQDRFRRLMAAVITQAFLIWSGRGWSMVVFAPAKHSSSYASPMIPARSTTSYPSRRVMLGKRPDGHPMRMGKPSASDCRRADARVHSSGAEDVASQSDVAG